MGGVRDFRNGHCQPMPAWGPGGPAQRWRKPTPFSVRTTPLQARPVRPWLLEYCLPPDASLPASGPLGPDPSPLCACQADGLLLGPGRQRPREEQKRAQGGTLRWRVRGRGRPFTHDLEFTRGKTTGLGAVGPALAGMAAQGLTCSEGSWRR